MNKVIQNLVRKIGITNPQFTEIELKKMEYGLICAFSDVTKFVTYFVIFYFLKLQLYFIVAAIFLSSIRLFLGGYHAETYWGCFSLSFTIYLVIILLGKYIVYNSIIVMMLVIISITLVFLFAPVDNINKRIKSEKRRKKLKYYSIIIVFILSRLCYLIPQQFLITAVLSIVGAVIMMMIGLLNNLHLFKRNINCNI